MTNHVQLLMTPEEKDGISNMTRVLGSRFAQYMNNKYQRTETLPEGLVFIEQYQAHYASSYVVVIATTG